MSRYTGGSNIEMKKKALESLYSFIRKPIYDLIPQKGNWNIYYGYDNQGCGYFIQFESSDEVEEDEERQFIDIDSLFQTLRSDELGFILRKLCEPSRELMSNTDLAYLDMPF